MIEDNPEEWIFDLFTADCYRGDPLGLPVLGVEESVQRLTRDRLLEHFRTHHSPSNMIITCVGRIDHDALVQKVDALFSRTGRAGAPVPSRQKAGKLSRRLRV